MSEPISRARERRQWCLFLLLAMVLLAAGIGLRDPWPSDEPRFALAAKQMVESGDWLFPHRGTELYSDKPPGMFWLQAASYEAVHDWRVAFLLPSLIAGLFTLWLTYDLGRRLWSHRAGMHAAFAVLFAFQFMYQVKRAQIDPVVMAWITLANWGLLVHFLRGPNWRAFWLGCFAAGVGVITKGVGILAFLMFVPYVFARARGWEGVTRTSGGGDAARWFGGVIAFLLPVLAWGLSVIFAAKARGTPEYAAYVNDLFFHQTAGRYAKSWDHPQPFWYYVPIVLLNWFPLSLAYFGAVPRWRRDLQLGEPRVMLPLVWSLLTIVFFSIPHGKRDVYLMPTLPMIALAMAPYLEEIVASKRMRLTAFFIALVGGLAIFAAAVWALQGHSAAFQEMLQRRELEDLGQAMVTMIVAIGAMFLLGVAWYRPQRGVHALAFGLGGLWLVWSFASYPLLNDSSSAAGVMKRARALAGADTEIGLVAWKEQNLLMLQGPKRDFPFTQPTDKQYADAVAWLVQDSAHRRIFILDLAMGDCVDRSKATHVGVANRRDWWMFGSDAVVPGCAPKPLKEEDNAAKVDAEPPG